MAKGDYMMGFLGGLNFSARLGEVALMSMLQKYIEGGEWKKTYGSLEELFDAGDIPFSLATYRRRLKDLDQIGPEIQSMLSNHLKSDWTEVRMIERVLTKDQREALKKEKAVPIGDRKVAFSPENYDVIMAHFNNLATAAANAEKADKKISAIEKEVRKEVKSLLEENEKLKAIITPETPEKLEEAFLVLDKMLDDFDNALRALVWKSPFVKDDPAVQAKIEALQTRAEKRFESLRQDWDAFCNGDAE